MLNRLWSFQDSDAVVRLWKYVGGWRVHAVTTTSEYGITVQQDTEARSRHSPENRIAVGTPLTDNSEARDILQQIGAIVSRNGLAGRFRVGRYRQHGIALGCGNHHVIESVFCHDRR